MDEHAGVLRLMALTLCRPIPTGHPSAPTPPEAVAEESTDQTAAVSLRAHASEALAEVAAVLCAGLADGNLRTAVRRALDLCGQPVASNQRLSVSEMISLPKPFFVASLCAPTDSGKSYLVRALVKELVTSGRADRVLVFSGNVLAAQKSYTGMLDSPTPVYEFSNDLLADFLAKQQRRKVMPRYVVLLDDILGTDADKSKAVRSLVADGRHLNIYTFVYVDCHWLGIPS
jgi:hypothetical protein